MEKPLFWIVALIIAAPVAVIVGAALPDGTLLERAFGGLVAGIATFIMLLAAWALFNLLHAGNRVALDAVKNALATAHGDIATLQAQIPTEVASRIPKNRDALVTCIVRMDQAVSAAISEYRVREMYKEQYGADSALDRSKLQAVLNARKELAVEIGIAGQDFSLHLRHFADTVDLPLNEYQVADDEGRLPLGQEACAAAEKKVWDQTADVLQRLDAGQLHLPRAKQAGN
jgi:hypothetical protein